jgi:spore germination cell wall hydrolase CwlJ-like protein
MSSVVFGIGYDVEQNLNRNITCMADAMYHEARGETVRGKIAVGYVIINRINRGYGSDPCEIVSAKNQFSWFRKRRGTIRENDKWIECYELCKYLIVNQPQDPTNGSIFFHGKTINPNWKYKRTVIIGNHIFYK